MPANTLDLLIVENNIADALLLQEALRRGSREKTCHVVQDGERALEFLRRENEYINLPRPDLIILDLNMPRPNGYDLLQTVKTDDDLREIPVIVMTASQSEDDVRKVYSLQANCYLPKPPDLDGLMALGELIDRFWFESAMLPSQVQPTA